MSDLVHNSQWKETQTSYIHLGYHAFNLEVTYIKPVHLSGTVYRRQLSQRQNSWVRRYEQLGGDNWVHD